MALPLWTVNYFRSLCKIAWHWSRLYYEFSLAASNSELCYLWAHKSHRSIPLSTSVFTGFTKQLSHTSLIIVLKEITQYDTSHNGRLWYKGRSWTRSCRFYRFLTRGNNNNPARPIRIVTIMQDINAGRRSIVFPRSSEILLETPLGRFHITSHRKYVFFPCYCCFDSIYVCQCM